MQRPTPLPSVKDNLVASRPTLAFLSQPPNVSRSWSGRDFGVRSDDRLTRSLGDRDQEKRVLEWCKKNNMNVVRKLPKLDTTLLTTKGADTEKFVKVVEGAPLVAKESRPKSHTTTKVPGVLSPIDKPNICQYCHRVILTKKRRQRTSRTFFTSPFECKHCGTSNDNEDDYNVSRTSSPDSEATSITESVADTIRRGDSAQVIDHRSFSKRSENSDNLVEEPDDVEEMDILWRNDANEYLEHIGNSNIENELNELSLNDPPTIFLTETSSENRPDEIRMAWDDEENSKFAEITRSGPGIDDEIIETSQRTEESDSKKSQILSPHPPGVCFFQEKDPVSGMKVLVHGRNPRSFENTSDKQEIRTRRGSVPGTNDCHDDINYGELDNGGEYEMRQSPVANRSIGLSRVALMRLSRQNRGRAGRSSLGTLMGVEEPQRQRTRSHDAYSLHKRERCENEDRSDT